MPRVPFIKPLFPSPDELAEDMKRIYSNNYYSNNGPVYYEFKAALETYLGQGLQAVIISNATQALILAVQGVFGELRDKKRYVAVPSFTFAAAPLAIRWCGFEPIFFDVDIVSSQPSLQSMETVLDKYGPDLAGVVLVNDFGIGNPDLLQWQELLDAHGLRFIIDSAPGFGSTYDDGSFLGAKGVCEIFSFHATKPFGIGEGGLLTTADPKLAAAFESMKNFGFDDNKATTLFGTNAKITELDCAIGLRVLNKFDTTLTDRRETYKYYQAKLEKLPLDFLPRAETAAIQFATIMVAPEKQPAILKALRADEVEVRTYYAPAVHTFPFFRSCPKVDLPGTDILSKRVISLPVHPNMDRRTIDGICDVIAGVLKGA